MPCSIKTSQPAKPATKIRRELGVPVRWVGVGEGVDDLRPFDAAQFADALFDKNVAAREASDED